MNKFNCFLCKFCGVLTALFCCIALDYAKAEDTSQTTPQAFKVICNAGYYLSKCGNIAVGTNWLKGIKGTDGTSDYYSYNSSVSDNLTNLRKFFEAKQKIYYTDKDGQKQTASDTDYVGVRDAIFIEFCTKGSKLTTECEKCPNNANVPQSQVGFLKNSEGTETFNLSALTYIYTIADCYVEEFSDNTGTYIYVPNSADINSNIKSKCYYSNNAEGDPLVSQ